MLSTPADLTTPVARAGSPVLRWAPLTGIAAVVLFLVSVAASSPPSSGASDARWMAAYTGSHDAGHIATGVCLVLAGLAFLVFAAGLWQRITAQATARGVSPLPVIAAAVTAACMSVGGMLMAAPSAVVSNGGPVPAADVLRLCNDVGFAMVAIPGMLAAALAIATLSVQGHRTALFGRRLQVFGLVVAVILLGSVAFVPIIAWLAWLVVLAIFQVRQRGAAQHAF